MNRVALLCVLLALPVITGCASSILPTSYLVHANVPYSDVATEGGIDVLWTDRTISMSPYKNILVYQFSTDKTAGLQPHVSKSDFGLKAARLLIAGLRKQGKNAVGDPKAVVGKGPYLIIQGNIAQLNPGRRPLRQWVGFGAGRAIVDVEVKVFRVSGGRSVLCGEFTASEMKSSLPFAGGNDIEFLRDCLARIATNISVFVATHRNRKEAPKERVTY